MPCRVVRDQDVAGYPNEGQFRLYVLIPLIVSAGSAAILVVARRLPVAAKRVGVIISVVAALGVFLAFGGGV